MRPTDSQRKDTTSRDQFDRSTKYMVQLQTTSTSGDKRTREITPKHDHGMFCYDQLEIKSKRFKHENVPGTRQRIQSKFSLFLGPTVDIVEFGKILSEASAELQSGKRELVQCTDNPDRYHYMIYGDREKQYDISDKVDKTLWQNCMIIGEKNLPKPPLADHENCKDNFLGRSV